VGRHGEKQGVDSVWNWLLTTENLSQSASRLKLQADRFLHARSSQLQFLFPSLLAGRHFRVIPSLALSLLISFLHQTGDQIFIIFPLPKGSALTLPATADKTWLLSSCFVKCILRIHLLPSFSTTVPSSMNGSNSFPGISMTPLERHHCQAFCGVLIQAADSSRWAATSLWCHHGEAKLEHRNLESAKQGIDRLRQRTAHAGQPLPCGWSPWGSQT